MVSRLLTAFALVVVAASPASAGWISMTSTAYPDSVVFDITIIDTGGFEACGMFAIVRSGQDVGYIQRHTGTTSVYHFVDASVARNTLYCYELALRFIPQPIPCFQGDLCTEWAAV